MKNILFEEKVPAMAVLPILLGFSVLMLLAVVIAPFFGYLQKIGPESQITLAILLLLDILVLIAFNKLKIILTEEDFVFGFWFFRKKVALAMIDRVEVGEYSFKNYYGYGIRMGRDRSWGYVPRSGKGVKVFLKDRSIYFVSSGRAEELAEKIKSKI